MFQFVHHVHYVIKNRDEMIEYFDKTFGMKPTELIDHNGLKEVFYDVDKTQIQLTEPVDPTSKVGPAAAMTERLAKEGPGVWHVAWGVKDIRNVAKDLAAKGNQLRNQDGITNSPLGYLTINMERASTHGMFLQLAEGKRKLKK